MGRKADSYSFASSLAFSMDPLIPFSPGVSTSLAPSAAKSAMRSWDMVSGMVRIRGYPLMAATKASPTPVLPEVGSMMTLPGLSRPCRWASSIMA